MLSGRGGSREGKYSTCGKVPPRFARKSNQIEKCEARRKRDGGRNCDRKSTRVSNSRQGEGSCSRGVGRKISKFFRLSETNVGGI